MTIQQLRYVLAIAEFRSMNRAAQALFVSQPNLLQTVADLEAEVGIVIFNRTNRGITLTANGEEFLSYARSAVDQFELLEERYVEKKRKEHFSVSMQHYSFAMEAFVEMVKEFGYEDYEFAARETKTIEVIDDVKLGRSEIGVLYVSDFNEKMLERLFSENRLSFTPILECRVYAYISDAHPLAEKDLIGIDDLQDFPCLVFDQGKNGSAFLAEEPISTSAFKRKILANDRATMLNLMVGLEGFTICSGILSEELNGPGYKAIPIESTDTMRIGILARKGAVLSPLALHYIDSLRKYDVSLSK